MNPVNETTRARYDDLPYGSYSYTHSAPEQLAAIAHLFGVPAPDVKTARVLELGAASGGNLIPVALRNPQSKTVGVELSGVQVAMAQAHAARLGIDNFRMLEADFQELDPAALGEFDYIVCHGVYSWIPEQAQDKLLELCGRCLSPTGVAYVSYNTYPGWKTKEIMRDAMLLHSGDRPAAEQVAYGRAMVEFLNRLARKGGVTELALRENLGQIRNSPADYIAHDYLEPENRPCYFHQFVQEVDRHGLAYLGEALPSMMMPANYGEDLAHQLYGALGDDQVRVEQYLDFAIDRAFRQTLLVHKDRAAQVDRRPDLEVVRGMHFAVKLACADGPVRLDGTRQQFLSPTGTGITTGSNATKQAITFLAGAWPGTASFMDIVEYAWQNQGDDHAIAKDDVMMAVGDLLVMLTMRGLARIRMAPVELSPMGERPVVDPLVARMVSALEPGQFHVANAWHDAVDIKAIGALLFPRLDGSSNRDALVEFVARCLADGSFEPPAIKGQDAGQDVGELATGLVDGFLAWLADAGVLNG